MTARKWIERGAWILGAALLAVWAGVRLHGHFGAKRELARFEKIREGRAAVRTPVGGVPAPEPGPAASMTFPDSPRDFGLWSPGRIRAYEASLAEVRDAPLAVLRIPRVGLEVAVLPGTSEPVLNRAVGWIERTARPGEAGNVGIAGHRDGFFRGLKDIAVGDAIELELPAGPESYRVAELRVVTPRDVGVLAPTSEPSLTLVTCYPFYYVGSAPERYIVRATRSRDAMIEAAAVDPASPRPPR